MENFDSVWDKVMALSPKRRAEILTEATGDKWHASIMDDNDVRLVFMELLKEGKLTVDQIF